MKKKILIRIGSLRHGGAEKVLVTFLKNLARDKYEIDLLLNLYSGKYLKEVPDWINVLYLNKGEMITTNRLQDLPVKIYRKIFQGVLKTFPILLYQFILKSKKYDIEIAANHGLTNEILQSPLKNSKKIVWIHSDIFSRHQYSEKDFSQFFKMDCILVISEKIKEDFLKIAKNDKNKRKIKRIYNPIDTAEIVKLAQQKLSFKAEHPTFLAIGTVYPAKGFDRLLKAHRRLLDENFAHKVWIVGDGYDFDKIKRLKTDLKLDDSVTLFGFQENPYPFFVPADYFILSSRYEGFPTVLFEAVTLRKNIIATDVSGVHEILQDGKLGKIVENSEEGIYEGMKAALMNPQQFEKYQAAMDANPMPFSLENSVNSLMQIFDQL